MKNQSRLKVGPLFLIVSFLASARLSCGVERFWLGTTSFNWVDGSNWITADGIDIGLPQDGDDLEFGAIFHWPGSDQSVDTDNRWMVNNISPSPKLHSLNFGGGDWTLGGDLVEVSGSIDMGGYSEDSHVTFLRGIRLDGDVTMSANGQWRVNGSDNDYGETKLSFQGLIDLNGHTLTLYSGAGATIEVSGVISGTGDVVTKGTSVPGLPGGKVLFSGPDANTFTGKLTAASLGAENDGLAYTSTVIFRKDPGVPVVTHRLRIEKMALVRLDNSEQIEDQCIVEIVGSPFGSFSERQSGDDSDGNVTVGGVPQVSSGLLLNGHTETIGSLVMTNFIQDSLPCVVSGGVLNVNVQIDSLGNATSISSTAAGDQAVPIIKGTLRLTGNPSPNSGPGNPIFPVIKVYNPYGHAGLVIQADMTQTAGLTTSLQGTGLLELGGHNIFAGGKLNIEESSTLEIGTAHALDGCRSVVLFEAGTLILAGGPVDGVQLQISGSEQITPTIQAGSLVQAFGNCAWNGPIEVDSGLAIYADNLALNGPISGQGRVEFLNGSAVIGGNDSNPYSGTIFAHCDSLTFNKPANARAFQGPLVVGGPGNPSQAIWKHSSQGAEGDLTLFSNGTVNLMDNSETFRAITFTGGTIDTGSANGKLTVLQTITTNPSDSMASIHGFLGLPFGSLTVNIADGAASPDLYVDAVISGNSASISKLGPGLLRFGRGNNYNALTLVQEGLLEIDDGASLGASTSGAVVSSSATLVLATGAATIQQSISLNGSGPDGIRGALQVINGASGAITGTVHLDGPTVINVGKDGGLSINAPITGTGPLTKTGPGVLSLGGTPDNTYVGDTMVNGGILGLNKPSGRAAVPANLIATECIVQNSGSFNIAGTVTLNAATWDLGKQSEDLSVPTQGGPALTLQNGSRVTGTDPGVLLLLPGAGIVASSGIFFSADISAHLALAPGQHHFFIAPGSPRFGSVSCVIDGTVIETSTGAGLVKEGAGTLLLSGNRTYTGTTILADGVLQVEGPQAKGLVQVSGGTLQGATPVGPILLAGTSANVAPHLSSGVLTADSFSAATPGSGTLQIQLNGTKPGTEYDQLVVRGACNLSGVLLSISLNFDSKIGDQFTIVQTTSANPIQGTFQGLPEGALFSASGEMFSISYAAAGGTEAVVTHVSQLAAPTTYWTNPLGGDWNNAANWNTLTVPNGVNAAVTNFATLMTITNQTNVSIASFYYDNPGATIASHGDLTLTGLFNWRNGSWADQSTINANGGLHIAGTTTKTFSGKTLINNNGATWSEAGTILFSGGAILSNAPNATFNCSSDGTMENGGGTNAVNNGGIFRKTGGTGKTTINVPFNNYGTVDVQSGTLVVNNGGTNTGTYVVPSGSGLLFGGAAQKFTETSSIVGAGDLSFTAGSIDFAGRLAVTNTASTARM